MQEELDLLDRVIVAPTKALQKNFTEDLPSTQVQQEEVKGPALSLK